MFVLASSRFGSQQAPEINLMSQQKAAGALTKHNETATSNINPVTNSDGTSFQASATTITTTTTTSSRSPQLNHNNNDNNNNNAPTTVTNNNTMINFIHIPKAGGTSIEHISLDNNHRCGLWGSRMVGNRTLSRMYNWSSGFYFHTAPNDHHNHHGEQEQQQQPKRKCVCAEWHMPASWMNETLRQKVYPAKTSFCLFREPLERLLSYYYYHFGNTIRDGKYIKGPCFDNSPGFVNTKLKEKLLDAIENPCSGMCHLTPQTDFLASHTGNWRDCNHVLLLDRDTLSQDFDILMEQTGCDIRFPPSGKQSNQKGNSQNCRNEESLYEAHNQHNMGQPWKPLGVKDLDETVLELAQTLYKHDFALYQKMMDERQKAN